jgi:hypothetical protein
MTPIISRNTRQKHNRNTVTAIFGPEKPEVESGLFGDEAGIAQGVAVIACGIPSIGT